MLNENQQARHGTPLRNGTASQPERWHFKNEEDSLQATHLAAEAEYPCVYHATQWSLPPWTSPSTNPQDRTNLKLLLQGEVPDARTKQTSRIQERANRAHGSCPTCTAITRPAFKRSPIVTAYIADYATPGPPRARRLLEATRSRRRTKAISP